MKTSLCALAAAACLAGVALAPAPAVAANGRGFGPSSHAGGAWHGGYGGHRGGYGGRGVFWGGVGLGLGIGAVGYYGGWWGPYGYTSYAPYPYYSDGYVYGAAPLLVAPDVVTVDPALRSGQAVPPQTQTQQQTQAARSPDPIFYPNKGQTAAATETDRRDCNRWATTQNGAMADASVFQRATLACMEGRGYTVK